MHTHAQIQFWICLRGRGDDLELAGLGYGRGTWIRDRDCGVKSKETVIAVLGGRVDEMRCPRKDAWREMRRRLRMKP